MRMGGKEQKGVQCHKVLYSLRCVPFTLGQGSAQVTKYWLLPLASPGMSTLLCEALFPCAEPPSLPVCLLQSLGMKQMVPNHPAGRSWYAPGLLGDPGRLSFKLKMKHNHDATSQSMVLIAGLQRVTAWVTSP